MTGAAMPKQTAAAKAQQRKRINRIMVPPVFVFAGIVCQRTQKYTTGSKNRILRMKSAHLSSCCGKSFLWKTPLFFPIFVEF
jgi:hypothetical protein